MTTQQIVAIRAANREALDALIDRLIPGDTFADELTRRGLAAHAATQVLNPGDFDRLVIGTGVYGR